MHFHPIPALGGPACYWKCIQLGSDSTLVTSLPRNLQVLFGASILASPEGSEAMLAEMEAPRRTAAEASRRSPFLTDQPTVTAGDPELFLAIALAGQDERIASGNESAFSVTRRALRDWNALADAEITGHERAARIYAPLARGSVSKPVTAQYLARILTLPSERHSRTVDQWRGVLPKYLIEAIEFVTLDAGGAEEPAAAAAVVAPDQPQE